MRNKSNKIIVVFLMSIFILLALNVYNGKDGIIFDCSIMEYIHRGYSNILFYTMNFISFLGSIYVVSLVLIILSIKLYKERENYYLKLLGFNVLVSSGLNYLCKNIVRRTRPLEFFRINYFGYSFPSGHAMINTSLILILAYIYKDKNIEKKEKKRIDYLAFLYLFLMGFSRLYLGVHWPTDIIGGYILAYLVYLLGFKFID